MNRNSPLVSILVPAYNAAPYLAELCESIRAQSHQNFEVLILDDGSTDGTAEGLAPFGRDPRFRILRWSPNRGVNAATSALLGLMQGEYWCNPGADDVLYPGFIAQRLELLQSQPGAVMVHGPAELIDAAGGPARFDLPKLDFPARMDGTRALAVLLQHNVISTSSVMARSDLTRLLLPFFLCDWKYAQDWYLWLLHAATGFDLLWDARTLHKYRVHERSLTSDPDRAAVRRAEIRLVPLCALSTAAQFSTLAAAQWSTWRTTLYRLWLFRAVRLHQEGLLQRQWLHLAGRAYYGRNSRGISLLVELCKHGWGIFLTGRREHQAIGSQSFKVSGIAQINDPIFC